MPENVFLSDEEPPRPNRNLEAVDIRDAAERHGLKPWKALRMTVDAQHLGLFNDPFPIHLDPDDPNVVI